MNRIPLAGMHSLLREVRRTRVLRLALAAGLVAAAVAAVFAARGSDDSAPRLVPVGRSGMIVLDVSASITTITFRQIERVLAEAEASGDRYGLVLFSDNAYEALPPGSDARHLGAFRRWFKPDLTARAEPGYPELSPGELPFPENPWGDAFSGGTRISSGLRLAQAVLARERIRNGYVVLVSDLNNDPLDLTTLSTALVDYRRAAIPLRVVVLGDSLEGRALFDRLLGNADVVENAPAPLPPGQAKEPEELRVSPLPLSLVALAFGLAALLAANELTLGRLEWARSA